MKIRVNKKSFIKIIDLELNESLDSVASTFSVDAFFDYQNQQLKPLFTPLLYNLIEIFDDEHQLMLTGTILNHDFDLKSNDEPISLSGYSLPGVIEDCNIPYSMYPLESLKMNLGEITRKLIDPFGLKLIIDDSVARDVNLIYSKSVCKPEDSIKEYISKLAAQRNVIVSHTKEGHLLMFRPDIKSDSVYDFSEQNTTSMTLSVNGQGMHSDLTILRQPRLKRKQREKQKEFLPGQVKTVKTKPKPQYYDTLKNPMIKVFRPAVKKMTEGEDTSTESAVRNYMADELRNIQFSIEIDRWERINKGDIITINSNVIPIQNKIRLMVDSLSRIINSSEKRMTINAVLPESFTGDEPKNIFV